MTHPATLRSTLCLLASLPLASLSAFSQAVVPATASAPPSQLLSSTPKPASATVQANYGKLPLSFEANQGQSDPQVKYLARGNGYSLYLTDSAAVLALTKANPSSRKFDPALAAGKTSKPEAATPKTDVVRMELAGANPGLRVSGAEQLPGTANYFIGNDPAKWRPNVPTYAKVKYAGVYPGIDLVYYGNQRQLEYDFVLAPGANPKPIRLHFAGASKLTLNRDGDLTVTARNGEIAFHKPVVYQTKDGQREPLEGTFTLLANNTIGFTLGSYDHTRELVIDPTLAYSTYLGGTRLDTANAIAVDRDGNAYITGSTDSLNFPTSEGAFQTVNKTGGSGTTVFVTKLNSAGSALIYSTYLGGSSGEEGFGIQVDDAGSAYVAGFTMSTDFPVTSGAFQTVNPYATAFVTKLSPAGSALVYSTYLGGRYFTFARAIAVDAAGHAFVTGSTDANFPVTAGAFQQVNKDANGTAFVTEFNPTGSGLVYSTYLGGDIYDSGNGIAVDSLGHAYVAGSTESPDFPVTSGAFQQVNKANPTGNFFGSYAGFITEFNAAGSGLVYSTFLGGSSGDNFPTGIAVDKFGNAYVIGSTQTTDFPVTSNAFQKTKGTPGNASTGFVTKLNPAGSGLVYSTYLGGNMSDSGAGIAVDAARHAYVTGSTSSTDFPVTPDAYQSEQRSSNGSAFLTELDLTGSALAYSTYLGGSNVDGPNWASSVALDNLGNVYLAGETEATDFPTTPGAYQVTNKAANNLGVNAFVSKFAFNGATTTSLTSSNNPQTGGESVTFTANVQPVEGTGVPAGIVSFIVDGVVTDHETLDGSGDASFATSTLTVGSPTIVASYEGQPTVYSSSSGALTETITGQVSAPTFNPPGGTFSSLSFVVLETASPGATIYYTTGSAMPTTSSTKYIAPIAISGTTTINAIAVETGDTQSPVATAIFTILPPAIATTTSIVSSLNPSTAGQSVTFTATVTAASGPTPTGSVIFKHGGTIMGSAPLVAGTAQFTTSSLTSEAYEILAVYTGSSTDANSHSPEVLQVVDPQ
jgi:hypothetical protein